MGISNLVDEKTEKVNKYSKRYTKEEIIIKLQEIAEEIGKAPTLRQATSRDDFPANRTIQTKFGSWTNLKTEAGLNVNESKNQIEREEPNVISINEIKNNDIYKLEQTENTKDIGNKAEVAILNAFIKRNISVSIPFGDNDEYDMIAEIDNDLFKIQCKHGNYKEDTIAFDTRRGFKGDENYNNIDYFAIYCPALNEIFIMTSNKCNGTSKSLRLKKPKNNQIKGVNFAYNYLIDNFLKKLN